MIITKEICLMLKEERRKELKLLPIDEKIKRIEELRERVEIIRNLRLKRQKLVEPDSDAVYLQTSS